MTEKESEREPGEESDWTDCLTPEEILDVTTSHERWMSEGEIERTRADTVRMNRLL